MNREFNKIVGTGGIGVGLLFESGTNETLGRNESRLAYLSEAKDYCKQHIVLHYTATLLSPKMPIIPIGFLGNDSYRKPLMEEMAAAGLNLNHVHVHPSLPTTISFCLQYPDKDGCNITASNGASDGVTPEFILESLDKIGINQDTILVAIPEVRPDTRLAMLRQGRKNNSFNVMSIPEAEAEFFMQCNVLKDCDLLAVNKLEAISLYKDTGDNRELARGLYGMMQEKNPNAHLVVTCGGEGAYAAYAGGIHHISTIPNNPVNTTGAGDAFLGGMLAGLAFGLPFTKGYDEPVFGKTPLTSAIELGALCAGMSVESVDTIAMNVNHRGLRERLRQYQWQASPAFLQLLNLDETKEA